MANPRLLGLGPYIGILRGCGLDIGCGFQGGEAPPSGLGLVVSALLVALTLHVSFLCPWRGNHN